MFYGVVKKVITQPFLVVFTTYKIKEKHTIEKADIISVEVKNIPLSEKLLYNTDQAVSGIINSSDKGEIALTPEKAKKFYDEFYYFIGSIIIIILDMQKASDLGLNIVTRLSSICFDNI